MKKLIAAAKPFPSQFRIGADIASIPRFVHILERTKHVQEYPHKAADVQYNYRPVIRLAFKMFNRLEWTHFRMKFDTWRKAVEHDTGDTASRDFDFARYLAGRWALKEAAVKAHTSRRLFLKSVTVIPQPTKPVILIDPPATELVKIPYNVAIARGLREVEDYASIEEVGNKPRRPALDIYKREFYHRRKFIPMDQRQVAEASLSHDGSFAIAVCQALHEPVDLPKPEYIVDSGEGDPIHEPELRDRDFLTFGLEDVLSEDDEPRESEQDGEADAWEIK